MLISYNWLKNYVPNLPEAEKLSEVFSMHVCEVESVEKLNNGDFVFDIKILPDRAHDLLSHRGVAKDLSIVLNTEYKNIEYKISGGLPTNLSVKIESENCRRYMGRVVRNVKVGPSPEWTKEHLLSMGQRSVNNLVDSSNIVMFDRGNPIHVFDLDKINGSIIIRQAKEGEKITTLDNKEVVLGPLNMVIADEKNILALAGIKGGKIAEVDENTKNIIIEVANFDPTNVRKTSKEVNIYTDAVKRFENDLSSLVASDAMNDMSALVLEICKDAILEEVVDIYPKKQEKRKLTFNLKRISKRLGLEVSASEVENIFKCYPIDYKKNTDDFEITVPDMRLDLNSEEDMSEEIGRILGYEKIEAKLPTLNKIKEIDETFNKIIFARNKFLNDGYSEVMTYSFRDKGEVEVLASASDKKFLRKNLTDGLRESLKLNQLNAPLLDLNDVKVFEIGTVFLKDKEEIHVAYANKKEIKEMSLEEFCKQAELDTFVQVRTQPDTSQKYTSSAFKMWSLFPFIARDIAVWVPENVSSGDVQKIIKDDAGELVVKGPTLFDEFKKEGKVSYAFKLVFQSFDRTLTDTEINEIMTKITNKIKENNDWQVR